MGATTHQRMLWLSLLFDLVARPTRIASVAIDRRPRTNNSDLLVWPWTCVLATENDDGSAALAADTRKLPDLPARWEPVEHRHREEEADACPSASPTAFFSKSGRAICVPIRPIPWTSPPRSDPTSRTPSLTAAWRSGLKEEGVESGAGKLASCAQRGSGAGDGSRQRGRRAVAVHESRRRGAGLRSTRSSSPWAAARPCCNAPTLLPASQSARTRRGGGERPR